MGDMLNIDGRNPNVAIRTEAVKMERRGQIQGRSGICRAW